MNSFENFIINYRETIREAFKKQDLNNEKFVAVVDDNDKVIGVVTDGDFRRAVWLEISLEDEVNNITNKDFIYVSTDSNRNTIQNIFLNTEVQQIPVITNGKLINIIFRKDFQETGAVNSQTKLNIPVVIMAGGVGARLDPFTRILPKPLIPIGDKPVIELIIDKFVEYGCRTFYISLNHKSKMIKAFFEDIVKDYEIFYIEENQPLGTAGALQHLHRKIEGPFIVSNCDIIIEDDYSKIYEFHKSNENALTLVGSMQHHIIPYGICKIKNGGELSELKEKPEYDFLVNTGMYFFDSRSLKYIPSNKRFDLTELIAVLKNEGQKVGVYPISEKAWIDIGQWEEYGKALNKLKLF